MNVRFISAVLAALSIAISGCGGGQGKDAPAMQARSAPVEVAPLVTQVEAYEPPASLRPKSAPTPARGERPTAYQVRSSPVAAARRADAGRPRGAGVPAQIGTAREVPATSDAGAMRRMLAWQQRANRGLSAAVSFTSEGAAGLRVGLLVRKLPADAVVRGYVQGADTAFEIPGRTILEAIQRNRDAGDVSDEGRTYWTPTVENEEVTLEIALPPGTPSDAVDISVPRLSHLHVKADDFGNLKIGQSASCEVDVSCASEDSVSRATAKMSYVANGEAFLCTGTLLNDSSSSGTPYFLSANHCISNQTAASTLITYWFYRSTTCGSGIPNPDYVSRMLGATLLYSSPATGTPSSGTDTSFMRLNEPPPPGAVFAAWSVNPPSLFESVIGVHHPLGDLQKFNQGYVSEFKNCTNGDSGTFSCSSASQSAAKFVMANWTLGTTEAGSSGSGLFSAMGSSRYLVGQLYGGTASCTFNGADAYGRLDVAYHAALSQWLSPSGRTAIYRFYNTVTGAHFFTPNAAERDWVISAYPAFKFEGVAFYAYSSEISGSSPVHRFFNLRNGRHFYTISAAERDYVLATYPEFSYEGISWYAQAASGGDATAIYRLYNATLGAHLYTTNEVERDWAQPTYRYEGVGYYAWLTQ